MEKMTRDQAIIKLLRENSEKDERIKKLEEEIKTERKKSDTRIAKLEEGLKRLQRSLAETDRKHRLLKERSSSYEHEISNIKYRLKQ